MKRVLEKIETSAKHIAEEENLELRFNYIEPFEANINSKEAVNIIVKTAQELKLNTEKRPEPFRWGEDFGLFTNIYPGAMFGIGAGEDCMPLHHPAYDFPDDIIETGINMFINIQKNAQ